MTSCGSNNYHSNSKINNHKFCDKKAPNIQINLIPKFKDNSRNIIVGSIGNMISDFSEETIISFLLTNNFKICKNSKAEKKIKQYLSNL